MKNFNLIKHNRSARIIDIDSLGSMALTYKGMFILCSNAYGWEHVSVSYRDRCPTWEEMCDVKDLFWDEEEVVVQYHPKKSEYINNHPFVLHLWRKSGEDFETPPTFLIGR